MTDPDVHLHHVGCLVPAIEETLDSYRTLGYAVMGQPGITIASQKVRVCFLSAGKGELVEPAADDGLLRRWLDKGVNFYHRGYLCGDLGLTLDVMVNQGGRILNRFSSEAFEGRECVFVLTQLGQMIELSQAPTRVGAHAA